MAALAKLFCGFNSALRDLERRFILALFGRRHPPLDFGCAIDAELESTPPPKKFDLKDIVGDGFLYAVPKHRRTAEKVLNRKFGWPEFHWKPLVPKKNIVPCYDCGHHKEIGVLCRNCYEKVRDETKQMQDKIQQELGLNPIESEVVVLYDGEKMQEPPEYWEGKRIVEMKKPRPPWFSKNLMQKTTQQPSTSTDIKPTELA